MPRTLHLHIGRHKTGSTSIQTLMDREGDVFRDAGIHVVRRKDYADLDLTELPPSNRPTNLFDIANFLLRPEILTGPRLRGVIEQPSFEAQCQLAECLNRLMLKLDSDLLLSAEDFSFYRKAEERALMDIMTAGFDVKTLLILRNQSAWRDSYAEQVASLKTKYESEVGLANTVYDLRPESWQFDMTGLQSVFPDADYLQYEEMMERHGSVIPGFLGWLGLDPGLFANTDIWENRT